jgi:hypothetical protein
MRVGRALSPPMSAAVARSSIGLVDLPRELDTVELLRAAPATGEYDEEQPPSGQWVSGTVGTVVWLSDDAVGVELVSARSGRTLDLLSVPADAVRVIDRVEELAARHRGVRL